MTLWLCLSAHGYKPITRHSLDRPSITILQSGLGSWIYWFEDDGMPATLKKTIACDKPPYRVPSMPEIAALPWNGLTVASTFSGCGGSCLGYRMAGYKVLWANEFVPAAQDSYRANKTPDCVLDCRDIRKVRAEEILEAINLKKGELDLFDGSPPCQAFSTAGKRHKGWGKEKTYEHGAKQRNEDLFQEYIRLLRGLMPRCFVAENVSGLVKGTCKGMFLKILRELKASDYRVECRLLDAQWLGVPQARVRTIFVGVRKDLCAAHNVGSEFPAPLKYRYSVREACPTIVNVRQELFNGKDVRNSGDNRPCPAISQRGFGAGRGLQCFVESEIIVGNRDYEPIWGPPDVPSPTILHGGPHGGSGEVRDKVTKIRRKFTIAELKRICSFPDDFMLTGTYAQQWARLGNSVPPIMMKAIAEVIRDKVLLPIARAEGRL